MSGVGVDLLEIERLERALERRPRLAERLFTDAERAYAASRARPGQHLAARFCAKEAVAKALGIGIRRGVDFKDIEVESDRLGRPSVKLTGGAAKAAKKRGVARMHLSLSHDGPFAVAFAVAEGKG